MQSCPSCCPKRALGAGHGGYESRSLFPFLEAEFPSFAPFAAKLGGDHTEEHDLAARITAVFDATTTLSEESFDTAALLADIDTVTPLFVAYRYTHEHAREHAHAHSLSHMHTRTRTRTHSHVHTVTSARALTCTLTCTLPPSLLGSTRVLHALAGTTCTRTWRRRRKPWCR